MKTYIITLLTIFSLSSYATRYNDNSSYLHAFNYEGYRSPDTSKLTVANSEILIIENDSAINVHEAENSDKDASYEEYKDVNVAVLEGSKSTRIIVHKDGDTIKNYEMNYDFQGENNINNFNPEDYSFDDKTSEKASDSKDKIFSIKKSKNNRFRGHWSGFEFGLNNYFTEDFSMTPEDPYMEINTGKSWNFNLNFAQLSLPLVRDRFGLVSGLGLEWNNYHFANANSIYKDQLSHTIKSLDLSGEALKKNRLQTTHLTVPLLLEVQLDGPNNQRIAVSGGVIAGVKLGSHTKYKTGDDKQKNKDDFYLQSFRYGFTTRINYDGFGFFFNYYNVPLFLDGKSNSKLYPFAAGMVLSFE